MAALVVEFQQSARLVKVVVGIEQPLIDIPKAHQTAPEHPVAKASALACFYKLLVASGDRLSSIGTPYTYFLYIVWNIRK